jgi:phosphatidylglycerophosphate synthase
METDALFILVLSLLVWQQGKAGPWVLVCGLLRYAFVAAAWAWPALHRPLPFSLRRKRIAALQMILLVAAFSPLFGIPASEAIATVAVLTLVTSFFIDLLWLVRT